MIENNDIKNLLITSDSIPSQSLVIAEWNMNRYQSISKYGVYTGTYNDLSQSYNSNDSTIKTGKLYLIYDDGSYKTSPDDEKFSTLASVFKTDRPDPGIVLLTHIDGGVIALDSKNIKTTKMNSASPRFYTFSESRDYDYFNSARFIDPEDTKKLGITADGPGGAIQNCNIFVVYENSFPCNKIVIKMQHYNSIPDKYAIDILKSNNDWEEIFSANDSEDIINGVLEVYYKKVNNADLWDTTPANVDNLSEIETPSTELKTIKGIRLRVGSMTVPKDSKNRSYKSSLELIEISPRIQADLTNYTENISMQSSIGDGEIGLPVGKIVSSNGSILLSNSDGHFLMTSKIAEYKLLSPEVEFRLYQVVEANSQTYNVPLKVMYSDSWAVNDDFTANVSLVDKMKLLSERQSTDMAMVTKDGVPMSSLILFLLDNCGITGYEFKAKLNDQNKIIGDTPIKTFFCKKEQTVTEVLEKIAVATQSSMFFDAFNKLNVLTKEKINEVVSNSTASFWLIMDENYNGYTASNRFSNYLANVISTNDGKIAPITDGKIEYRAFGVNKSAGYSLLQDIELKDYLEDNPFLLLTGTGYGPKFTRLWSADQTKESVLATGALIKDIGSSRVKEVFTSQYPARTQEDAVRLMYEECKTNENKRKTLLIAIDQNDIFLFDAFNGYVMIDQEIISYNGKVFSINGVDKVLFSKDELNQEISNLDKTNSSIVPKALVIDVIFNPVRKNDTDDQKYDYTIKSDGRAQFGTEIALHVPDPTDDYITKSNAKSFVLGETYRPAPSFSFFRDNIEKYYDFSKFNSWSKLRSLLGISTNPQSTNYISTKNYNGLLKLIGPPIPDIDRQSATGNNAVAEQNVIDEKISVALGDFGPFVYTYGEKNVYIQKINLTIEPTLISSRFKLLSSKENQKLSGPEISAHSSIAGIGFGLKEDEQGRITNGYFFEVESIGSAGTKEKGGNKKERVSNIRFYRVTKNDAGKLIPDVLAVSRASIIPSLDTTLQFNPNEAPPADQIVTLEIRIQKSQTGKHKFSLYYGNKKIKFIDKDNSNKYIDSDGNIIDADNELVNIWSEAKNIFMFVRNDSSVVFDYMLAAINPPNNTNADTYYSINNEYANIVNRYQRTIRGELPDNSLFTNNLSNVKYFDFANVVREVKKYTARYEYPSLDYKLIDISQVNPKYRVIRRNLSSLGAEIVVVNTSNDPISLSENSSLPLFIIGTQIEEITKGEVSMKNFYNETDDFGYKQIALAYNKSLYGEKTFNLSSDFIQSIDQANDMMRWVIRNCSRERFEMSMEIMFNPLLELGDKVKVFSSSRGYYEGYQEQENDAFGNKTFMITAINHSISFNSISTKINIIEVGE